MLIYKTEVEFKKKMYNNCIKVSLNRLGNGRVRVYAIMIQVVLDVCAQLIQIGKWFV
jgi:hypothetical protein